MGSVKNPPIFTSGPLIFQSSQTGEITPIGANIPQTEITLRDLFAVAALEGWLSGPCQGDTLDGYDEDDDSFRQHQRAVAKTCYGYANAMLAGEGERKWQ